MFDYFQVSNYECSRLKTRMTKNKFGMAFFDAAHSPDSAAAGLNTFKVKQCQFNHNFKEFSDLFLLMLR